MRVRASNLIGRPALNQHLYAERWSFSLVSAVSDVKLTLIRCLPGMAPKKVEEPERKPLIGRVGTNLKVGIVGVPNVGKSTFFNVLTKSAVAAENFPFCTINPNENKYLTILLLSRPDLKIWSFWSLESYLNMRRIRSTIFQAWCGESTMTNNSFAHLENLQKSENFILSQEKSSKNQEIWLGIFFIFFVEKCWYYHYAPSLINFS